jgi:hypothetical protein
MSLERWAISDRVGALCCVLDCIHQLYYGFPADMFCGTEWCVPGIPTSYLVLYMSDIMLIILYVYRFCKMIRGVLEVIRGYLTVNNDV